MDDNTPQPTTPIGLTRQAVKPYFDQIQSDLAKLDLPKRFDGLTEKINKAAESAALKKLDFSTLQAVASELSKAAAEIKKGKTTKDELNVTVAMPEEVASIIRTLTEITIAASKPAEPQLNINDYKPHDNAEAGGKQYIGFVHPTGAWYIMCNDIDKNQQRYAGGPDDYAAAWSKRRDLKYGLISDAI